MLVDMLMDMLVDMLMDMLMDMLTSPFGSRQSCFSPQGADRIAGLVE